jgi:hypothetical protein
MNPKEEARCQFMRILRTLPYGNATFFTVRRIGECTVFVNTNGVRAWAGWDPCTLGCNLRILGAG